MFTEIRGEAQRGGSFASEVAMKPITVTINDQGKITDVDFVQWIMNEIGDKMFKRSAVADTYAILLQKGVHDFAEINRAIIERWSRSGLEWIKKQAWKRAKTNPRKGEFK